MKHLQLIRLLVGRELTLRYKRSVIGIGWTLLNPMLTSFVLWVVFSYIFAGRLPDGQQYAPYLMAGIVLNSFFNQGLLISSESIANNAHILTKIYVPPQIFPISVAIAGLVNFFIGLIPLAFVVMVSGQTISWTIPLVIILGLFLSFLVAGIGLALATVVIRFDDTKNIINVFLMILTYLTPIFYPIGILNPQLQRIVNLNPLTSYLDCFRWAFSNNATASTGDWIYVGISGLVAIFIGTQIFNKFWPRTVAML